MITTHFSRPNWFDNVEERAHPWPGLNWLTAMLLIPDVKQALDFYKEVFAFVPIFEKSDEYGNLVFARMRYRGCNFCLNKEGRFNLSGAAPITNQTTPPFYFYFYVDDVDELYDRAISNGCKSLQAPYIEIWGDKKARIEDPFRYIWDIALKIG